MAIGHDLALAIYAVATVGSVALAGIAWRQREQCGAVALTVTLAGAALWTGSLFALIVVDSLALSAFFFRFLYVGVVVSVLSLFLFILEYTGHEHLVTPTAIALLSIEPAVVVVLAFVNPGNVFFESVGPDPTVPGGISAEMGIAFDVHLIYSYLLLLVGTAMVAESLYAARSLYRGQAATLLGATTAPLLANAVHTLDLFGLGDVDTTPIGFVVAGALFAISIGRYRLIDIAPIARDRVIDTISEGVFVFDRDDRVVDANPAARAMVDIDDGDDASLVGRRVDSLCDGRPDLLERYRDLTATADESSRSLSIGDAHYDVHASPIDDRRNRHVGWVLLVRDVTDRKRRERELERQNERLDRFASMVSHDLRNPLSVADGYVSLARETGDVSHLEDAARSLERMETIIDDVLALTRDGEDVTDPEPVALETLAERAWDHVDADGDAATLTVETEATATIRADADRTTRLLENLFRNAIEHGRPSSVPVSRTGDGSDEAADPDASDGGPTAISIAVGPIDDEGAIEGFYVEDDGRGIPPDQRERIFESGYTGDGDGTGLGLSIVERIAEVHGWAVEATESEAGGARFEVTGVDGEQGRPNPPERTGPASN
ncbi:sensor histidine kinase [Halopiger thermotolerans]